MKKRVLSLFCAVLLLLTPCLAYGGGSGDASYINETALANDFTYENAVSYDSDGRTETYTLELAPGSGVYPISMACDTIYGGFTATQMISYAEALGYNVVGAINSDFGEYNGVPTGMVVEKGVYKSSPEGNNAVAFTNGRAYVSEKPEVTLRLVNEDSGYACELTHFNKSRTNSGAYLFSEHFSTVSTRTSGEGWFVRFAVSGGEDVKLGGELELTVTGVSTEGGSVPIGAGNLVLTASAAAGLEDMLAGFEAGDRVTLYVECSDSGLDGADWVGGCGNILVKDGSIYDPDRWNSAITDRHPRTALGIMRDGTLVFQVLDGRSGSSVGATMEELARDLISRGCVSVVNLDGGGSSIMKLRIPGRSGFTTVNEPSDGKERAVSAYILFVTDSQPGGQAQRLFLEQDGAYVLAGSTVDISFAAADSALQNASLPENISVSAQRGSISDMTYTAPSYACTDTLSLSGGGAAGSGTIHVIERVDELKISVDGGAPQQILLDNGESIKLDVTANYLMRDVNLGAGSLNFSVEGGIGAITSDGILTAVSDESASGQVNISCGGIAASIPVRVAFEFSDMRGHWASDCVKRLYEAGIVTGISDTEFGPGLSMKRCDFLVMLYRAAGEPSVSGASGFEDVPADSYFADAVNWAVANGITNGRSEDSFAPYDTLARQEGFTFLYRALKVLGTSYAEGDITLLNNFSDGSLVAGWAANATATLIANGIVQGSGSGLNPTASLSRAEMAKMLDAVI